MSLLEKIDKPDEKLKSETKKQEFTLNVNEDSEVPTIPTPLMPELEELVAKNPNRLIGCGG